MKKFLRDVGLEDDCKESDDLLPAYQEHEADEVEDPHEDPQGAHNLR
jgi:hypothetical protein